MELTFEGVSKLWHGLFIMRWDLFRIGEASKWLARQFTLLRASLTDISGEGGTLSWVRKSLKSKSTMKRLGATPILMPGRNYVFKWPPHTIEEHSEKGSSTLLNFKRFLRNCWELVPLQSDCHQSQSQSYGSFQTKDHSMMGTTIFFNGHFLQTWSQW